MTTTVRGACAVAALCALLSACGGGGGDSAPPPPPPTPPTALPASVSIAADARVEAGASESFTSSLTTTTGVSFHWDFGDGTTGSGATATHTYATTGTYQVTLAIANTADDLRTASWSIDVGHYSNVASLSCTQAAQSGWCWQHANVTGHAINDIFFTDATHAWAVGANTTILKSADAGNTWTQVGVDASLDGATLQKIRFRDANNGMAVANNQSLILVTSDGGATWTPNAVGNLLNGGASDVLAYTSQQIVLAGTYGNDVFSFDGGQTWATDYSTPATLVGTNCYTFGFQAITYNAGCTSQPVVQLQLGYPYTDPNTYFETVQAGAFTSPTNGLAIGYGYFTDGDYGLGWSTSDGGATWSMFRTTGLTIGNQPALTMTDASNGWLTQSTSGGNAAWTADGGHTWTAVATPSFLLAANATTWNSGLVGAALWESAGSRMAITTDKGATWSDLHVAAEDAPAGQYSGPALVPVQILDANDVVVSTADRFYATHDGGQTWARLLGPDARDAGASYGASAFLDAKHGSMLNSRGELLSTADGGQTWTRQDFATTTLQPVSLQYISATEGWLVLGGKLAHTTDGGTTWNSPLVPSAMSNLTGSRWLDAAHGWAWGTASPSGAPALFATADDGVTWTTLTVPANSYAVSSVLFTSATAGVLSNAYAGGIYTTTDGGQTWTQSMSASRQAVSGQVVPGNGSDLWTIGGTPARSTDGGITWTLTGLTNTQLSALAFTDATHGWAVGRLGEVYYTIDGGLTWSSQPVGADLNLLTIAATDNGTAWMLTADGQVLATATAGF